MEANQERPPKATTSLQAQLLTDGLVSSPKKEKK